MMYEADFNYFLRSRHSILNHNNNNMTIMNKRRKNNISVIGGFPPPVQTNGIPRKKVKRSSDFSQKKRELIKDLLYKYCEQTTVHGIKYWAQKDLSLCQKCMWVVTVASAFLGIIIISYFLQLRFASTPLATVVESTIYPVANIPYPAVTICNYNRVNWNRVEAILDRYLLNASDTARTQFTEYLRTLNTLEYGSFDEFIGIQDWNIHEMDHIDLLQVYKEITFTCDELFHEAECWWRNKYINCCDVFDEQKSEYGLCFAFNSVLNPVGLEKLRNFTDYPWRTAQFADWSGLRVDMKLPPSELARKGLVVAITNPWEWPGNAYIIPAGTNTGIMVRPTYSYATEAVLGLTINERKCLFPGEKTVNNKPIMNLPLQTESYASGNCYSECRQRHMIKFCNCTIAYFFQTGNYTPCTMEGVRCLNKFDEIMNYVKPPKGNPYFNDDEEGISCECIQECTRTEYAIEISPNLVGDTSPDQVTLDVHFQRNTIVIYRTDLLYGWMDLLVGFGGIFGLFLGGSVLSGVELLFYVFTGLVIAFSPSKF